MKSWNSAVNGVFCELARSTQALPSTLRRAARPRAWRSVSSIPASWSAFINGGIRPSVSTRARFDAGRIFYGKPVPTLPENALFLQQEAEHRVGIVVRLLDVGDVGGIDHGHGRARDAAADE